MVGVLQSSGRIDERTVPDMSFATKFRLAIDGGELFRMDYTGKDHQLKGDSYSDQHSVNLFNSHDGRRYAIFLVSQSGFPTGHISKSDVPVGPHFPEVLPVRLIYRPLDHKIGVFDTSKLRLARTKGWWMTALV